MDDKDRFGVSMEEQLAAYKAKIEAARLEAKDKGQDFFDRWSGDLEHLLEKYDKARYKATLLRKGSGDALVELRHGVEHALADLKAAFAKARDKF
ncbi:sll1863 family stress response protein [Solidesulfovibrio sp.]